jgi:hypothetical protein
MLRQPARDQSQRPPLLSGIKLFGMSAQEKA